MTGAAAMAEGSAEPVQISWRDGKRLQAIVLPATPLSQVHLTDTGLVSSVSTTEHTL